MRIFGVIPFNKLETTLKQQLNGEKKKKKNENELIQLCLSFFSLFFFLSFFSLLVELCPMLGRIHTDGHLDFHTALDRLCVSTRILFEYVPLVEFTYFVRSLLCCINE